MLNPQLNIIKAVNNVSTTGNNINLYKKINGETIPYQSLLCYRYIDNILVYQANSITNLAKVLGLSIHRLSIKITENSLV